MEDDTARVIEPPSGGNSTRNGLERRRSVVIYGLRVSAKTSLAAARLASRDTLRGGGLACGRTSKLYPEQMPRGPVCDPFACSTVDWYR